MHEDRIRELEAEITEMKEHMPVHSIPNHIMQRLMELGQLKEQIL
jgi:hypothetical protein